MNDGVVENVILCFHFYFILFMKCVLNLAKHIEKARFFRHKPLIPID